MWIYSKEQGTWVNLNNALRIGKSGNNDYIVVCSDGYKVTIDQKTYDYAMQFVDPQWYEKQKPKDPFDFEKTLLAIAKATGAKVEKEKEKTEGEED